MVMLLTSAKSHQLRVDLRDPVVLSVVESDCTPVLVLVDLVFDAGAAGQALSDVGGKFWEFFGAHCSILAAIRRVVSMPVAEVAR